MLAELTTDLADLIGTATGVPVQVDPIRPPGVPGAFIVPPRLTTEAPSAARLTQARWEVGLVAPAVDGAWLTLTTWAEASAAAIATHALFTLTSTDVQLWEVGDQRHPGYRIDVTAQLPFSALTPTVPEPSPLWSVTP